MMDYELQIFKNFIRLAGKKQKGHISLGIVFVESFCGKVFSQEFSQYLLHNSSSPVRNSLLSTQICEPLVLSVGFIPGAFTPVKL